ncbi:MAG: hypothetical protein PHG82_00960 [Candidatus Gracilibacteria bacterium]|nr:hypothetical protein [Candidatus Gracilibacteria bacterium]
MTAINTEKPDTIENINSLGDLEKFGINPKGMEELAQPISISRNELKKFKEEMDKLPETEKLAKTKEFLKEKANTLFKSEQSQDKLKNETQKTLEAAAKKAQTGVEGAKEAAKDLGDKASVIAKEVGTNAGFTKIVEQLSAIPLIGGILGFLFKTLGGLFGFSVDTEKLKEEASTAKEAAANTTLNPSTQKEIKNAITGKIGFIIPENIKNNPIIKAKLDKALNDPNIFSPDIIKKIEEDKAKGQKIDILYLKSILGDKYKLFKNDILDEEGKQAIEAQMEKRMVDDIQKRYNVDLSPEKRAELTKVLKDYKSKFNFAEVFEQYIQGKPMSGFDMFGIALSSFSSMLWFSMTLIGKGIISMNDIGFKIVDSGLKSITLMTPFGVRGESIEEFKKEMQGKSEAEKMITLGLLYREAGIFFGVISGILQMSSRLAIESFSPGTGGFKGGMSALKSDFDSQIKILGDIEKSITGNFDDELSNALNAFKKQIIELEKYYKVANILEKSQHSKTDIELAKKEILDLKIDSQSFNEGINKIKNFDELRSYAKNNIPDAKHISYTYKGVTGSAAKDYISASVYEGKAKAISMLNQDLDDSFNYIKSRIRGGEHWYIRPFRSFKKMDEIEAFANIKRDTNKVILEGTPAEQLTKLQAMSKLATDSPEFFRLLFPGVTGFTCIGLSFATAEEGQKWMGTAMGTLMMLRVAGPAMLILSAGNMFDPETKKVEWFNVASATAGSVLIGVDGYGLIRSYKGGTNVLFHTLKYVVSPITDMGKFAIHSGKMTKNIIDVAKAKGTWGEVWNETKGMLKGGEKDASEISKIAKASRYGKMALLLGVPIVAGSLYAYENFNSIGNDFQELEKKGILDKDGNVIKGKETEAKKWFNGLNDNKKASFLELIFSTKQSFIEPAGNMVFKYENGKFYVSSKTYKDTLGEILIKDPRIESYLESFGYEGKIEFVKKV